MLLGLFILTMMTAVACGESTPAEDETFTVTFETDGGTEIAEQVVDAGDLVTQPADPEREGFIFTGVWNHGDETWDFNVDTVNDDITLTAVWVGDDEEVPTESVHVSAGDFELPEVNNPDVRPEVELGTEITLTVDFEPAFASNQAYTITTSNSRAEADGNTITFVFGITGPGNVSVLIEFDDEALETLEFRFRTIPAATEGIIITDVIVNADNVDMPEPNDPEDRPRVAIGTTFTLDIEILPENAENKNYTISSSNSRAEVDDHTVTFVYGATGPGRVSIRIFFEDSSVGEAGMLEYRFETFEDDPVDVEIDEVIVNAGEFALPEANDSEDRPEVEIGTEITLDVEILPENASNQNYTVTTSNSRANANGNTITFLFGNTGPGNVSVFITFEDASVGDNGVLEYRFETIEGEAPEITIDEVIITVDGFTLPNINDSSDRPEIEIGTVLTLEIEILPEDASNKNYVVTTSNSRAEEDGNTVTFVYGNTGPGFVSIRIYFDDTSVGDDGLIEFRFSTVEAEEED